MDLYNVIVSNLFVRTTKMSIISATCGHEFTFTGITT